MPLYLLNSIPREPPKFELNHEFNFIDYIKISIGKIKLDLTRDSYVSHLNVIYLLITINSNILIINNMHLFVIILFHIYHYQLL